MRQLDLQSGWRIFFGMIWLFAITEDPAIRTFGLVLLFAGVMMVIAGLSLR
jgi:hypothetical protein